jgi:hypothetical protein
VRIGRGARLIAARKAAIYRSFLSVKRVVEYRCARRDKAYANLPFILRIAAMVDVAGNFITIASKDFASCQWGSKGKRIGC